MQYERIYKNIGENKEKLKDLNTNLDVTFNGIVEFVKLCSEKKPENL